MAASLTADRRVREDPEGQSAGMYAAIRGAATDMQEMAESTLTQAAYVDLKRNQALSMEFKKGGVLSGVLLAFGFGTGFGLLLREGYNPDIHATPGANHSLAGSSEQAAAPVGLCDIPWDDLQAALGSDLCDLLVARRWPGVQIAGFQSRLGDGRVTPDELHAILRILALKWPKETLAWIDTLDQKVVVAWKLNGLVLARIAKTHPEIAIKELGEGSGRGLSGDELYQIGVSLHSGPEFAADLLNSLAPEIQETIASGQAEAVLRRDGASAMVGWVSAMNASATKEFDENGALLRESSGSTSYAIGKMGELLQGTTSVSTDELISRISRSAWWGEPIESSDALQQLGRIDPGKALEMAGTLKGHAGELGLYGAFAAASEYHPDAALRYISQVFDRSTQNMLLQVLAQKSNDSGIRKECEDFLIERGIPMGWK